MRPCRLPHRFPLHFLVLFLLAGCRASAPPVPAAHGAVAPAAASPAAPAARRVVLISLDGAGSRELHRLWAAGELKAGGFARFFAEGQVAEALIPVDPTLTAVNHVSLATGFAPDATGIVSNRFQAAGTPFGTVVSGFSAPIGTEMLWEAARRQGRRVGVLTWPGADDAGPRRRGDWGLVYAGPPDHPSALVELARADWRPVESGVAADLGSRSPVLAASVEPDGKDSPGRSYRVLAVDRTDDGVVDYDAVAIRAIAPGGGEAAAAAGEGGWVASVAAGPEGPAVSWIKVLALAPDLARVRLYFGAAYRNQGYPEDFPRELEAAGLRWPGAPDEDRLSDTWEGRPGIDLATWTEQAERFGAFFFDALRLGSRERGWDLLLGYVPVIDEAGHKLSLLDPRQPGFSAERRDELARARLRVWQAVDRDLARLLAALDLGRTTVAVVSDHGMAPVHTRIDPNALLRDAGLLVPAADGRPDPERSQAYAARAGAVAHVYLDPATPPDEWAARLGTIRELFATYETGGERPIERVLTRSEAAEIGLDHPNSGDLILFAKPGYTFHEGGSAGGPAAAPTAVYGMHGHLAASDPALRGIFLAVGSGVPKRPLGTVRSTEVAGKVSRWLGIEPPRRQAPPE